MITILFVLDVGFLNFSLPKKWNECILLFPLCSHVSSLGRKVTFIVIEFSIFWPM